MTIAEPHPQASTDTTVLLVEDEPLLRLALAEALRERGVTVIECVSGEEGLDVILSGRSVDAVVTDVRTPGSVDGFALARAVKELSPTTPVLIASGHADGRDATDADVFLSKPVPEYVVVDAVERLVERRRSAS